MPTRQEIEAQYRKEESRQNQLALFKRISIWTGVVIGLFAMVYGLAQLGSVPTNQSAGTIMDPVDASDWTKGNQMAQTTIVEYGDFQCPGCASAVPFIKQIEQTYGSQVKFVFRHYPLRSIHPNAQSSSQAAEAAGRQGKFWEMHDLLFANQNSWSSVKDPMATFEGYAEELQLNIEQFRSDFSSKDVKDKIDRDLASGNRASVQSTPSFYLNGQLVNFASYDEFEQIIKQSITQ